MVSEGAYATKIEFVVGQILATLAAGTRNAALLPDSSVMFLTILVVKI
jgi:hypothetical protein